jgi:peptide/nickel transport system substrate-binding protein
LAVLFDGLASSSIRTQWHNQEYHQLILDGKQTVDQDKRAEIYKKALKVFYDEVPAVAIAHSTVIWPARNNVMNFKLHPTGSVRMKNVWLK